REGRTGRSTARIGPCYLASGDLDRVVISVRDLRRNQYRRANFRVGVTWLDSIGGRKPGYRDNRRGCSLNAVHTVDGADCVPDAGYSIGPECSGCTPVAPGSGAYSRKPEDSAIADPAYNSSRNLEGILVHVSD